MSYQGGQARQRSSVGQAGLDRVETRQLQASDYVGVERRRSHESMVAPARPSMEVQTATVDPLRPSRQVQAVNWDALIFTGLDACGLTHTKACELMVDDDGKPLDPSLWNRMRRDGNLPFGRMRHLPLMFWWHFGIGIGEAAGLDISHASIGDVAVGKTQSALHALADLLPVLMRRAG